MMHDHVMADFNIKEGDEFPVINSLSFWSKINSLKTHKKVSKETRKSEKGWYKRERKGLRTVIYITK